MEIERCSNVLELYLMEEMILSIQIESSFNILIYNSQCVIKLLDKYSLILDCVEATMTRCIKQLSFPKHAECQYLQLPIVSIISRVYTLY